MQAIKKDWFIDFYNDDLILDNFTYDNVNFDLKLFLSQISVESCCGKKIFDQCCGYGRLSKIFLEEGSIVYGCDISLRGIQKLKLEYPLVNAVVEDARIYITPELCDIAINHYSSFPYFDDDLENEKIIKNMFLSLKTGGILYLETIDSEFFIKNFKPVISSGIFIRKSELQNNGVTQSWYKDEKLFQKTYMRLYSQSEMMNLINKYLKIKNIIKENGRIIIIAIK